MRRQQATTRPLRSFGAPREVDAVDLDLLRAISWGNGHDLPVGVVHLASWRLIRAGLVARTTSGLVVTDLGNLVLDEDDF